MSEQEDVGGSEAALEVGEMLTFGLQGGCWVWGEVEAIQPDTLTLRSIRVTDDLSTPPGRGGKLASGGRATIRREAIVAVVDGTFREWE